MKSAVIAYKERTVQEILSVAAELQGAEALKLLSRGEQFVRSSLPDVSAKKKLSSLLLLRGKRMKPGSRSKVNQELVPMLLEVGDTPQLQELLADMNEQEVIWLLHQVDGDVLESLSVPGPHKILVCKELARRITDSPVAEAQSERLSLLWDFLSQQQENQDDQDWAQAASLMLAALHGRLTAKLERLDTKLLHHALTFLRNKERATCQRTTSDSKHLEGLLLKVQLEQVEDIPAEVVSKLCLEQESLKSLHGSQLMLLAKMLEKANRRADGARVALAAAEFFSAKEMEDESHDAIVYALSLDHTHANASTMLCELLRSIRGKCKELSSKCRELEKAQQAIKPPVWHLTWDLSNYDFTNFTKKQEQLSEKFQLGASGVEAWLDLRPVASANRASLYLRVSEPVCAKWRFQVGRWEDTTEHEFAKKEDGSISGHGWKKKIPISDLSSNITFHLLSVRREGSSLQLVAPRNGPFQ